MIEVIVGAAIMFVGVILGYAAPETRRQKKQDESPKTNETPATEKLDKALMLLRNHHTDIPQDVGDEIEELINDANGTLKSVPVTSK